MAKTSSPRTQSGVRHIVDDDDDDSDGGGGGGGGGHPTTPFAVARTHKVPWAAEGVIPVDTIKAAFPTAKARRFDILLTSGHAYQLKARTRAERDMWVDGVSLLVVRHKQLAALQRLRRQNRAREQQARPLTS